MQNQIKRYPVQNPILKKYIKFFWELRIDHAQLNHKLIPQRNINMRFNLSNTPHYICTEDKTSLLEAVYFIGLRNKFTNNYLYLNGNVDVIGICFQPDGLFPFLKIPVSEFKNQILGTEEISFKISKKISVQLKEISGTENRLTILENELIAILNNSDQIPEKFRLIFNAFTQYNSLNIKDFCKQNNISLRQLERMYLKYVGLPACTYSALNRFHGSLNQLLNSEYSKLSDVAYDNSYFDQMHFIKEFKRFTGNTPGKFINQNDSILQIGKLN